MKQPLIERIANGALYVLAGAGLWLTLPISADVVETPKRALLFLSALIFTVLWIVQTIRDNEVKITVTPFLLPGLGLLAATALSSFIITPNPQEGLVAGGVLFGSVAAILLFAPGLVKPKVSSILTSLNLGGLILAVTALLQLFEIGPAKFLNDNFQLALPNTATFALTGSVHASLAVAVILGLANIGWLISSKEARQKSLGSFFLAASAVAVAVNLYILFVKAPGQLVLTPLQPSWSVAIDMLKNPRTALLGAGPASYGVAFAQFRPVDLNLTTLWTARFESAANSPLHYLTTIGIIGLVAWIGLMIATIRLSFAARKHSLAFPLLGLSLIIAQLLLPPVTPLWILFAVTAVSLSASLKGNGKTRIKEMLLGLIAGETNNPLHLHAPKFKWFAYSIAGIATLIAGWSTWQVGKVLYAENLYLQSVQAANWNKAGELYEKQRQLVQLNSNSDATLRVFASTNFLLARNISQQKELSEADRQQLPILIQQAVESAKRATAIEPRKTENWQVLASIYDQLIGTVDQADQYAVSAYVRAIQTNPSNPLLRMSLASVYARANNFEQAKLLYQQTIELKPDWPNAYYNLSVVFRAQKNLPLALQALQLTKQYANTGDPDFAKLETEINDLTAEVKKLELEQKAKAEAEAAKAAKAAGAAPNGQIKIPEDLGLPKEEPPLTLPQGPKTEAPTPKPLATLAPSPSPVPTPEPGQ